MVKGNGKRILILCIALTLLAMLLIYRQSLSATMWRHQLILLPGILLAGALLSFATGRFTLGSNATGISALILVMASLVFWMIPRSIDLAVIEPKAAAALTINLLVAGFLLVPALRSVMLEIRIAFQGMIAAMLMAAGITMASFNLLLCSSYSIQQQKTTGFLMILVALSLFLTTLSGLFIALKNPEIPEK